MTPRQPPDTVESAAEYLQQRFGEHVAALMAYGSRVCGEARTGSAFDFWLIVRDLERFHHDNAEFYRTRLNIRSSPEKQIALNRTGPNFYAVKPDGIEIKFAVIAESDFAALCRASWWTVKGRMQKPLRVIRSTPAVDAAILAARREGLACALNLVPRKFTLDEMLHQLVGLSYRAEVRPEHKHAKVRSILKAGWAELLQIYLPLLAELPFVEQRDAEYLDRRSPEERRRARQATLRTLRRSKWCYRSLRYVWRNFRSHRAPIRYLIAKILGEMQKAVRRRLSGR